MEFIINLTLLEKVGLTPTWYSYLMCCYKETPYLCANEATQKQMAQRLEKEGWCKISAEGVIPRGKFIRLVEGKHTSSTISQWITEWRELFPSGVKSAGRPVRGDKQGVLKKMKTFCSKNPEYTKDQIMEATRLYIEEKRMNHFQYTTCADYFISKDGISILGALIEDGIEKEELMETKKLDSGSAWHKEV